IDAQHPLRVVGRTAQRCVDQRIRAHGLLQLTMLVLPPDHLGDLLPVIGAQLHRNDFDIGGTFPPRERGTFEQAPRLGRISAGTDGGASAAPATPHGHGLPAVAPASAAVTVSTAVIATTAATAIPAAAVAAAAIIANTDAEVDQPLAAADIGIDGHAAI